jgi:hypothetical protein
MLLLESRARLTQVIINEIEMTCMVVEWKSITAGPSITLKEKCQ